MSVPRSLESRRPPATTGARTRSRQRRRTADRYSDRPRLSRSGTGRPWLSENITIDIPRNKITALIGPSGCGKSTLLRCFNRMNDLIPGARMEGEIRFDGELISAPAIPTPVVAAAADRHGLPEAESRSPRASTTTSPGGRGSTATGATWTNWSSARSAGRPSGTRSRTSCIARGWISPAASSSGSASPGRWPSSPRSS